jgi:hypothetical protein
MLVRAPCAKKWSGGGKGGSVALGIFLKGPAAWSSGVGSLRAPRGGRRRGSIGPKPTEAGDSDQKRSQADRCGRRLDRGGGGKMGRQHVGPGATVSRNLTVQVIETEIQMISNKFKTV